MPSRAPPGAPPEAERRRRPPPPRAAEAMGARSEFDFWIVLDFEWTCDEGEHRQVHSDEGEIIEFAYVIYDVRKSRVSNEGQHYCKPLHTPITEFCTKLTGISNEKLKDAGSLKDALSALDKALTEAGAKGKTCCAVAHGCADLELILPRNCRDLGLEIPPYLRKYIDLREATQGHLASIGERSTRASSLKQICEALRVEMLGDQHCGLDDSWMVLLATQQLLKVGAALHCADLDAERRAFQAGGQDVALCLDGLPYHALGAEIQQWLLELLGETVPEEGIWIVLGMDLRPSGRAIIDFGSHDAAARALSRLDGGRRMLCGSVSRWPFEAPRERLVLARPLRQQERAVPRQRRVDAGGVGPLVAPFPWDATALDGTRRPGRRPASTIEPAAGVRGTVKFFNDARGFGFIASPAGEVFVHIKDCDGIDMLREGDVVSFDIVQDGKSGKIKAAFVQVLGRDGSAPAA